MLAGAAALAAAPPARFSELPESNTRSRSLLAFYPQRNLHPVQLVFASPGLEGPELLSAGAWRWELSLQESNTLNRARLAAPSSTLLLDLETTRLTLGLRRGLRGGWELGAELPLLRRWGGVLDRPIETVERAVSLLNPLRGEFARNQARMLVVDGGLVLLEEQGTAAGVGDLALTLGKRLRSQTAHGPALAARLIIELPTGSRERWLGNGGLDLALALSAGRTAGSRAWVVQVAAVLPSDPFEELSSGSSSGNELPAAEAGAFLTAGVGGSWRLSSRLSLYGQLTYYGSPISGTGFAELERSLWECGAGLSFRLGSRTIWQVGGIENLVVEPGVDFSLVSRLVIEF